MKTSIFRSIIAALALSAIAGAEALDLPTRVINGVKYYFYVVKKGETLYAVSHELGISRDDIVAENPGAADGLRAGQQLYFPFEKYGSNSQSTDNPEVAAPINEQPHIPTPPVVEVIEVGTQDTTAYEPAAEEQPIVQPQKQEREVALFMPFMLDDSNPGKPAEAALEFYRGFLLGIDSIGQVTPDRKIKVSVYDTEGKMLTLKKILAANESLQNVDLIIAPDNAEQIELLGKWGKKYNVPVLNLFAARDTSYLSNSAMINGNIPTDDMLEMAADYFANATRGYKPVILKHKEGSREKQPFVDMLADRWRNSGVMPITIEYPDRITEQTLTGELGFMPSGTNFVFISPTAAHSDFVKYAMALPAFKETIAENGSQIMLLGYPEWTTFRSDALKAMYDDNTMIYTRFFNDQNSFDTQNVNRSFEKWYGQRMAEGVPSQGLLGYDTAALVLRMLNSPDEIANYSGLQTRFIFKRATPDEGGFVNQALQIVRFMPGEIIDNTSL